MRRRCGIIWLGVMFGIAWFAPPAHAGRQYMPSAKRFMQRDPLLTQPVETYGYQDGVAAYGYLANRPTCAVDPNGTFILRMLRQIASFPALFRGYGNWCGPVATSIPDPAAPPCAVDLLDLACCWHDRGWDTVESPGPVAIGIQYLMDPRHTSYSTFDRLLCRRLQCLAGLNSAAEAYRQHALVVFDCANQWGTPGVDYACSPPYVPIPQTARCRLCQPSPVP